MSVRHRAVGTALTPVMAVLAPVIAVATTLAVCPPASAAAGQTPQISRLAHAAVDQNAIRRKPITQPLPPTAALVKGTKAVDFAASQLGKPYRYGGTGPDAYDCSGLTQQAWRAAGVSIPRTTQTQARVGTAVPLGQIRPGDLVIFYADHSHVGIYAGEGKVIVSPHRGAVVKYAPLQSMPISTVRRPG